MGKKRFYNKNVTKMQSTLYKGNILHDKKQNKNFKVNVQVSVSVQLLSHVRLFVTPWTAAHQASLSISSYWSLLKLTFVVLVMPSKHLILCCPLLLLPSIFPSIRVFSVS